MRLGGTTLQFSVILLKKTSPTIILFQIAEHISMRHLDDANRLRLLVEYTIVPQAIAHSWVSAHRGACFSKLCERKAPTLGKYPLVGQILVAKYGKHPNNF